MNKSAKVIKELQAKLREVQKNPPLSFEEVCRQGNELYKARILKYEKENAQKEKENVSTIKLKLEVVLSQMVVSHLALKSLATEAFEAHEYDLCDAIEVEARAIDCSIDVMAKACQHGEGSCHD